MPPLTMRLSCGAFLISTVLLGQSADILTNEIRRLAAASTADDKINALTELKNNAIKVKLAADGKKINGEFLAFHRADVQNGASGGASGTTSAILSPLLPAIFGVAFETGALTRTVSGNTITLKANPAGLICASGDQTGAVARRDPETCRTFWKKFGLTASFDTGRGDKSTDLANLQAINNQFTEFTARYEIVNRRTFGAFKDFLAKAKAFSNMIASFTATNPAFEKEVSVQLNLLIQDSGWAALGVDDRAKRIAAKLDEVAAKLPEMPELRDQWLAALKANQRSIFNKAVLTAQYSYQQPDLATEAIGTIIPKGVRPPNLHTAALIYAQGVGDKRLDFTANVMASWFQETRPGMRGLFRDFKTGLEGKFRLREIANYGAPTLSFAGLYVYLHQEPLGLGLIAFNQAKISERGHIGLFQTKLEFPTANNAIRIPISFSYSNRTELIKESDVRGQIGISFNLDALFIDKK